MTCENKQTVRASLSASVFNVDMIACQWIGSASISGEDFGFGNILTWRRAELYLPK